MSCLEVPVPKNLNQSVNHWFHWFFALFFSSLFHQFHLWSFKIFSSTDIEFDSFLFFYNFTIRLYLKSLWFSNIGTHSYKFSSEFFLHSIQQILACCSSIFIWLQESFLGISMISSVWAAGHSEIYSSLQCVSINIL